MFAGIYPASFAEVMASGMTYLIVPTVDESQYSAQVSVTDKSGNTVLNVSDKQKERRVTGFAAAPLMLNKNARQRWQYASSEEFLTVRVIRELMNSSMFSPKPKAKKAVAKPKGKPPATAITKPAPDKAAPANRAATDNMAEKTYSEPGNTSVKSVKKSADEPVGNKESDEEGTVSPAEKARPLKADKSIANKQAEQPAEPAESPAVDKSPSQKTGGNSTIKKGPETAPPAAAKPSSARPSGDENSAQAEQP